MCFAPAQPVLTIQPYTQDRRSRRSRPELCDGHDGSVEVVLLDLLSLIVYDHTHEAQSHTCAMLSLRVSTIDQTDTCCPGMIPLKLLGFSERNP